MRFGISVCTLGPYADPREVAGLARVAEDAGWEALFVWDHLGFTFGMPSADPWVTLAAAAQATDRIRLGTGVTALPRRRPHVVANTVASLDRLSAGRAIFGAGLGGVAAEFSAYGEPDEPRVRAEMLDEGLTVLAALWSGEPVEHDGAHYTVRGVTLAPLPVQRPRVPVWIGGDSDAAKRRAARWDGWIVTGDEPGGTMTVTPGELAERIKRLGPPSDDFDVALTGVSAPGDGRPTAYAEAGATWWLESVHGLRGSLDEMTALVAAGPPGSR